MPSHSRNTQMFALGQPLPAVLELAGGRYALTRIFKHDFWAATCLYQRTDDLSPQDAPAPAVAPLADAPAPAAAPPSSRIVVKFGREQAFCGLPLAWTGIWMRDHEEAIYRQLRGIPGVPRWVGRVGRGGYAIEYVDGLPLDHFQASPPGFFDALRQIFDAVHARGVAYCDANKRSNILVTAEARPCLIDYQIAFRRRADLPWPLRSLVAAAVAYMQRRDLYHLYKHKRRYCPEQLTAEEDALSRQIGPLHQLHRKLTKPYRSFRRRFLKRQYEAGRLVSPTADLEDHYQPEKETWRKNEP